MLLAVKGQALRGIVTDTQGNPKDCIEILASDMSNNTIVSVLTDERGSFAMELKDGRYILRYRELGLLVITFPQTAWLAT